MNEEAVLFHGAVKAARSERNERRDDHPGGHGVTEAENLAKSRWRTRGRNEERRVKDHIAGFVVETPQKAIVTSDSRRKRFHIIEDVQPKRGPLVTCPNVG